MNPSALARFLVPETQLLQQQEREFFPSGICDFDAAVGGLPRGAITEIYGGATSGKTTFLNSFIARATGVGEFCALVDAADTFDPASAFCAAADLQRLLWVRCHGIEQSLKAADLLIHGGGWGVIALDFSDAPPAAVRRIPMSWWYRFRLAVENTPTVLIVLEREPFVKNCAALALEFPPAPAIWSGNHPRFRTLSGTGVRIIPRKPVRSRESGFETKAQS